MKKFVIVLLLILSLSIAFAANVGTKTANKMDVLVIVPPNAKGVADKLASELGGEIEYRSGYVKYLPARIFEKCQNVKSVNYKAEAEKFLAEYGLKPKLPYKFRNVVKDGRVVSYRNGTTKECTTNVHVNFDMYYNGVRLFGPGAKVRVYFGERGVGGVISQLWSLKSVGKVKIKGEREVINEIEKGGAKITSVELVYFVPLPEEAKTYVYPAYVVKYTTSIGGQRVEMAKIVPAVPMEDLKKVIAGE